MSTSSLLQDVESFLTETGMNPTQLGIEAMSDPNFIFDLRAGRDIRLSTAERLRLFMSSTQSKNTH